MVDVEFAMNFVRNAPDAATECEHALTAEVTRLRAELAEAKKVREPVRWFAAQMERKLAAHDSKGGWADCQLWWLHNRAEGELSELVGALSTLEGQHTKADVDAAIAECADVANFVMMIADNLRRPATGDER